MNWPFWVELMVRSGALLLVGEALRRMSNASGAAFRHRLLFWAFALLAVLPVLSVVFPEIPVSFWRPAHALRASVTAQQVSSRVLEAQTMSVFNWPIAVWIAGFILASAPLVVGLISAWRMVARAAPLETSTLREAANRVAGKIDVMTSNELRVPVTCGLLRPKILLPRSAEEWSYSRMEAVLLHELAHIKRRDLAAQVGTHLVAALWWFQPLVWMLRRELRAESEFACDAEVIQSGFRASVYAEELLGVARNSGRDLRLVSTAIGMVRRSDLEERLLAVLNPGATMLRRRRVYLVGLVLGAASIAAATVSFDPKQNSEELGGSTMKRTIISALLTSAGLTAGTVGGYIHDANGTAIADAKVSIYTPDKTEKMDAVTNSEGKFSLSLGAGQYVLRIEKPGLASIFRVFDLKTDSAISHDFTMANEGTPAVEDSSIAPMDSQPKHIRVGGEVAQSNLILKVTPIYPVSAKQARIQGTVQMAATISKEGVPIDLRVESSPSDDLSESALEGVRQWRYRPTLLNGDPVEIETTIIVNYTLSQ